MTEQELSKLGSTLWGIADDLRGAMNADDFRDYMLSFLFLRYLSDNYEAAAQKELGADYPKPVDDDKRAPLSIWYAANAGDVAEFEKQMRRKVHYVIEPQHLWSSIAELARTQNGELLHTLEKGSIINKKRNLLTNCPLISSNEFYVTIFYTKPLFKYRNFNLFLFWIHIHSIK
jgi:type I restriction enzyme M protein